MLGWGHSADEKRHHAEQQRAARQLITLQNELNETRGQLAGSERRLAAAEAELDLARLVPPPRAFNKGDRMITVTTSDGNDQYPNATRYITDERCALVVIGNDTKIAFYPPGMFSKVVQSDEPVVLSGRCESRKVEWGSDGASPLRCMGFRGHGGLHFWCES